MVEKFGGDNLKRYFKQIFTPIIPPLSRIVILDAYWIKHNTSKKNYTVISLEIVTFFNKNIDQILLNFFI